jgi:hypothetical protein
MDSMLMTLETFSGPQVFLSLLPYNAMWTISKHDAELALAGSR